jgi:hypothetical protein
LAGRHAVRVISWRLLAGSYAMWTMAAVFRQGDLHPGYTTSAADQESNDGYRGRADGDHAAEWRMS